MLSQLVYVSKRKANCTTEEIDKILASCKQNNPDLGITGILLYSQDKFIQLVEGESSIVMKLYDKIKKDDRHKDCVMISLAPIKEKSFPSWHMGSKQIKQDKIDYNTEITTKDKQIFDQILSGKEGNSEAVLKTLQKFFN